LTLYKFLNCPKSSLDKGFISIRSKNAEAAAQPASSKISIVNTGHAPYAYILSVISLGPSSYRIAPVNLFLRAEILFIHLPL